MAAPTEETGFSVPGLPHGNNSAAQRGTGASGGRQTSKQDLVTPGRVQITESDTLEVTSSLKPQLARTCLQSMIYRGLPR